MKEVNIYADLEIRILEKQDRGYPVEITFNGDQEFPRGFLDPSGRPPIDAVSPRESGSRLFQWLFSAPELMTAWAQARGRHPLRRIRLRIDAAAPELHAIPWESLCEPGDGAVAQTLAAMDSTPFSRYLAGEWIPGGPILKRPIRILVAVADPSNLEDFRLTPVDAAEEWRILKEAVGADPAVELVRLTGACTLNAIESELRKGVHILYLVAHGQFFGDHSVLYLAREDNRVAVVKDSGLSAMFARQLRDTDIAQDDKLRLVHLSSCHTASRCPADAFRGLAPQLVACGVPAVIAMQDAVPVPVAQAFSRVFYRELLDHGEVDRASNAARCALLTAEMRGAAIPVLFMRLRYGQIFANPRFGVFLACNPGDAPVVEELATRLLDAGVPPWFDKWHLPPGTSWQEALDGALDQSSAIAVFMGPGALPPWQNEQVRIAIDQRVRGSRGALRIVPILLPGARREQRSKLPVFLVSTTWVEFGDSLDNDNAFYRLLCGIRGKEPGAQAGEAVVLTGNPYRGLEYFDVGHQDYFFGREALVEWLVDALRPQPGASENRFLALIGPSGSGKSSLSRAGLLAAIRAGALPGSSTWPVAILRPGPQPLESLAIALAPHIGTSLQPAAIRGQTGELLQSERTVALSASLACHDASSRRLVILVDQFEELFTQCASVDARRAFIDNLMVAANEPGGRAIVLLTLRADFYGECSAHPVLAAALSDHQVLVGPMREPELRRAIERPALLAGAEFEHGLVDALLDEVRDQPGCLPLLEDTLLALWQRREGRKLTHAAYQSLGKVAGALERRAEDVFGNLPGPEREVLRRIFLRLVQSIEGGGSARRLVSLEELLPAGGNSGLVSQVVSKLAAANVRLLTLQAQGGAEYVDIAHEALIRNWPRLQGWMNEDREFQLWLKRLNASRREWDRTDRHPDGLLRGALLDEAERWFAARADDLNRDETFFIEASRFLRSMREEEAREQQQKLEEEQQRRLQAETERAKAEAMRADLQTRSAGRLRKLAAVLALLLVAVLVAAGVATWQRMVANRERTRSYSLNLANLSETVTDPDLRVLLALHAAALSDSPEAEAALQAAAQAQRAPRFYAVGQAYQVLGIASSPDGKYLATGNSDDTVTFWNAAGRTRIGAPLKIDAGVESIAFLRDGSLAVGTAKGSVRVIDESGNPKAPEIPISTQELKSLAVSPGGILLASANQDHGVGLWTFPSGPLKLLQGHSAPVRAAAFSPKDGKYLVTVDGSGAGIGWNPASGSREFQITSQDASPFTAVAFHPNGSFAVTGDAAGALRVWAVPAGKMLDAQRHGAWKRIEGIAFNADGRILVSSAADGHLRFWDAAVDGRLREKVAIPCAGTGQARCTVLAFLSDGQTVAVAGQNGEVRLYQTDFAKLFAEARNSIDPARIDAEDCRRYLSSQPANSPARRSTQAYLCAVRELLYLLHRFNSSFNRRFASRPLDLSYSIPLFAQASRSATLGNSGLDLTTASNSPAASP